MKRTTAVTIVSLYALLAFLAVMISDFHDRSWPQALAVKSQITLDFTDSAVAPEDRLGFVTAVAQEHDLGLLRVVPDLDDTGKEVFVALGGQAQDSVGFFGDKPKVQVVGIERLEHSSADGAYAVQRPERLDEAIAELAANGVGVVRSDASLGDSVVHMAAEAGFLAPFIAGCLLVAAVTVFWLAAKARSRALRVLAGSAPWRIQAQDVGSFFAILIGSAAGVGAMAAALVGLLRGWVYVPMFATLLGSFEAVTVAAAMLLVLVTSAAAWPSADLFAYRRPAVGSLRLPARIVQAATLLALIAFAGPTWAATQSAAQTARQLDVWNELSDQVRIQFTLSDEDMDRVGDRFLDVVSAAERDGQAALSYTVTEQDWQGDFGGHTAVSIVTGTWIDLVSRSGGSGALVPVDPAAETPMLKREFKDQFELWQPEGRSVDELFDALRLYRPAAGERYPVSGGGAGELSFLEDVLIVQIPSVGDLFDGPNTVSLASTGNIVMTGADATQARLAAAGLDDHGLAAEGIEGAMRPVYMAEQGILEAQYATYLSRLLQVSLGALCLAFLVAAGVNAMVAGILHARRDFPLRLGGATWESVVRPRALRDVLVGATAALVVLLVALRNPETLAATALAALAGLAAVYASHIVAASAVFTRVTHRKL